MALRERQEREEWRNLLVLGTLAQIFGVDEAEDMERVSAKTLEVGMKWRATMGCRGGLSISAFPDAARPSASPPRTPTALSPGREDALLDGACL